jgi:predicted small lipoprotein YifL
VKKVITALQVAVLATGFTFALTGCGGKTEPGPMENEPPPDPAKPLIPDEPEK